MGERTRDGIGKYYMGREISQVMGHLGAGWLERPKREQEERTDLLIKNMQLGKAEHIADIGAGSGYFSFRISPLIPERAGSTLWIFLLKCLELCVPKNIKVILKM